MKLNKETRTLTLEDKEIKLTNREYDFMFLLIKNRGNIVLRETIMAQVFDDYEVKNSAIISLVFNLRKKVDIIKIRKSIGYYID